MINTLKMKKTFKVKDVQKINLNIKANMHKL